ncbi:hypothetical protein K9F62_10550 [Desulfovibrio sp. JY]|nr:hypothetical protein K9F62_10550 [Desulfovibrio sp. JY]
MPRARHILCAMALSLLLAALAPAADTAKGDAGIKEAAGLCAAPAATVAFSCKTRDNYLVAVCTRDNGLLQLVFEQTGKTNTRVALPKDPAEKASVRVGYMLYSGGGGSYGGFKAGDREYVAYSGFGKGWKQAGMSEVRGEKHLAEHICLPATRPYDIGFPLLGEKAGYARDAAQDFDLDVQ